MKPSYPHDATCLHDKGPDTAPPLETVLQRGDTWRGRHRAPRSQTLATATGYSKLDRSLHLGGWPKSALSEIYCSAEGIGEFSMLLPALRQLSQEGRRLFLVNPPYRPYAPALAAAGIALDRLYVVGAGNPAQLGWCLAEILADEACAAALCWFPGPVRQYTLLRKLQLAASQGGSSGFLFRHKQDRSKPSPAALRLSLEASGNRLQLQIHKQRGGSAGQQLTIPRHGPAALHGTALSGPERRRLPLYPTAPNNHQEKAPRPWH